DRALRRDPAGARRRGHGQGADHRRALCPWADRPGTRRGHGLPRLRLAGWRLPVPRYRRDLAGDRRGAGHGPATQRAGAFRRAGMAGRGAALALMRLSQAGTPLSAILTRKAVENALLVHAAFGGSTNLLLHVPAIARAAGLAAPTVADWTAANRATPRLVDALPNGPRHHP